MTVTNILKDNEINDMRHSGKILATALHETVRKIKPGITTFELDQFADKLIVDQGATPSFKDYEVKGSGHYKFASCISVNDEIVHGLPSDRVLAEGDVISIDLGAKYQGLCSDMAITAIVGSGTGDLLRLVKSTEISLRAGIAQAVVGNRIGDIGAAVESVAKENKLGVVRDYVGHGIGRAPHLPPSIPNYGRPHTGEKIVEGMALAIEPMFMLGKHQTVVAPDGWTVLTYDGSTAAHFEHTVLIVNRQPEIVTKP